MARASHWLFSVPMAPTTTAATTACRVPTTARPVLTLSGSALHVPIARLFKKNLWMKAFVSALLIRLWDQLNLNLASLKYFVVPDNIMMAIIDV